MTHEWKVGDRAIATGYALCDGDAVMLADSSVIIDRDTYSDGFVVIQFESDRIGDIHVRNLTPDRRKGDRRGKQEWCRHQRRPIAGCLYRYIEEGWWDQRTGNDRRVKA